MPHEYRLNELEVALRDIEPNPTILELELRMMATYLVKVGTDVQIALDKRKHRLLKHQEINATQIAGVIRKYSLADQEPLSLIKIATNFPCIALEIAASTPPGNFDERRFWWCANNYNFYLTNSPEAIKRQGKPKNGFVSSRLLSDVLCEILTLADSKLITISALHLSIKYSESRVYSRWFNNNRALIVDRIEHDAVGRERPRLKERLRKIARIEETEAELSPILVDQFIEWWNLTGLRRPTWSSKTSQ